MAALEETDNVDLTLIPPMQPRTSESAHSHPEMEDMVIADALDDHAPQPTSTTRAAARVRANPSVRFGRRLAHNALKKAEDLGIGIIGVTDVVAQAGEGVGSIYFQPAVGLARHSF